MDEEKDVIFSPLTKDDVEIRVGSNKNNYVQFLIYKSRDVDLPILRKKFGFWNVKQTMEQCYTGCFITTIYIRENKDSDWVCVANAGGEKNNKKDIDESNDANNNKIVDKMQDTKSKADATDSIKRAGFLLGIGDELYDVKDLGMGIYNAELSALIKEKRGNFTLEIKQLEHLQDSKKISKIVAENYFVKITFELNKKALVVMKTTATTQTTNKTQPTNNKCVPVDITTIEEILLRTPSKKGYNAKQIYDYYNQKNWYSEKSKKPITAETIKLYAEKGWL